MINTKELRLGSWINVPRADQSPFRIDEIEFLTANDCKVGMHTQEGGHPLTWYLKDLEPIPLTPSILLNVGFHEDNYGVFEFVRDNAPYVSGCDILLWCKQYEKDGKTTWEFCMGKSLSNLQRLCDLDYLHQLQNLFFILCGKELEINIH